MYSSTSLLHRRIDERSVADSDYTSIYNCPDILLELTFNITSMLKTFIVVSTRVEPANIVDVCYRYTFILTLCLLKFMSRYDNYA